MYKFEERYRKIDEHLAHVHKEMSEISSQFEDELREKDLEIDELKHYIKDLEKSDEVEEKVMGIFESIRDSLLKIAGRKERSTDEDEEE